MTWTSGAFHRNFSGSDSGSVQFRCALSWHTCGNRQPMGLPSGGDARQLAGQCVHLLDWLDRKVGMD